MRLTAAGCRRTRGRIAAKVMREKARSKAEGDRASAEARGHARRASDAGDVRNNQREMEAAIAAADAEAAAARKEEEWQRTAPPTLQKALRRPAQPSPRKEGKQISFAEGSQLQLSPDDT